MMKTSSLLLAFLLLLGFVSCEPDFPCYSDNIQSECNFVVPSTVLVDRFGGAKCVAVSGKDSCFVQLVTGEGVVKIEAIHNIGDTIFFGGITSYIKIIPIAEGVATCRLYNNELEFDTIISIRVASAYQFFPPSPHCFLISERIGEMGVVGPEAMNIEIMDNFIMSQTFQTITPQQDRVVSMVEVVLHRVGTTYVKFYNEDADTIIPIRVLPVYSTFTEPPLDFNDTQDSVRSKLIKTFSVYTYLPAEQCYQIHDSLCMYNLYVNYSDEGTIKDYTVDLYQGADENELSGYINERYYRTAFYENGLPIFIKAVNVVTPSISGATVMVIPDYVNSTITYKDPVTYSQKKSIES